MKTYFDVIRPTVSEVPIVVDVPHAGEWIPPVVRSEMEVGNKVLRRDLDLYMDQIWQDAPTAGATLIVSNVSRYVVDLNRAADDVSEKTVEGGKRIHMPGYYQDRGVVWRTTTDGTTLMADRLTPQQYQYRIDTFHTPYHQTIRAEIDRIQALFGFCILVDGHSMPSMGRRGPSSKRADIVPGDVCGTTCGESVHQTVVDHFTGRGYSVAANDPYQGGWITRSFSDPRRNVHTMQIEVNRELYMNEKTFEPKPDGIERLREASTALLPALANLELG